MLKQRVITAVVLVAILLLSLLASEPIYWQVFISVALLVGFYEWLSFCQIEAFSMRIFSFALFIGFSALLKLELIPLLILVPFVCLLWLVILAFTLFNVFGFLHMKWVKLIVGLIILASAGWLMIEFKRLDNGAAWIIRFFLAVIAADVGAYFVGKRFGRTKLAPNISPGKTVEGLLGGLALVVIIFVPMLFYQFPALTAFALLITAVLTAIVSVGGDLFESKLKRYVGLKDSSQILPGHGGVLDRVDSLMAGAPIFALGLLVLGRL